MRKLITWPSARAFQATTKSRPSIIDMFQQSIWNRYTYVLICTYVNIMEIIHGGSLKIIALLADGEKSLTELSGKLSVTKTMALRMLASLEESRLIQSRIIKNRNGRSRLFKLSKFSLVLS